MSKQKLELTWIWKDRQYNLEPRILIERPDLSYGDQNTDNILIHGDNLLALKALEQKFSGQVKCIYIDPPYNTGNAFEHYDDWLEHSDRLNLMKPRLELLKELLSSDGSIWISIDAYESHYLKILCDEVFWRSNFVDEIIWQRSYAPINLKKTFSRNHDTILVYSKDASLLKLNKLERSDEANDRFSNPDNDPRWPWASWPIQAWPRVESRVYEITTPSGRKVLPPPQYCRRISKEKYQEMVEDNRIYFWPNNDNIPRIKRFLSEVRDWIIPMTLWLREEAWDNQEGKSEIKNLFDQDIFDTPKPERLIHRILHIWSNSWDLILDSFLWSGTSSAVAQKMWRRRIGIELGEHAYTHAKLRMDKVVDGENGWVSNITNWRGGGGYKFYELGPSLLIKDQFDQWIINPEMYDANKLIQALCKVENFTYFFYDDSLRHGKSTEKDFLHVTTRHITQDILNYMADEQLKQDETLLILTLSYDKSLVLPDNIQIKKIPAEVIAKCERNKNDYSLPITENEETYAEE